jgi:TPR repeat protein
MAADQGNAHGQFNHAIAHLQHIESDRDYHDISRYLKLSADQRCALGEVNYGGCLFRGFAVSVDLREAARYCERPSSRGMSLDRSTIGFVYLTEKEFQLIEVQLFDVLIF